MKDFANQLVLVSGKNDEQLIELSLYCGLNKFLTTNEYISFFP